MLHFSCCVLLYRISLWATLEFPELHTVVFPRFYKSKRRGKTHFHLFSSFTFILLFVHVFETFSTLHSSHKLYLICIVVSRSVWSCVSSFFFPASFPLLSLACLHGKSREKKHKLCFVSTGGPGFDFLACESFSSPRNDVILMFRWKVTWFKPFTRANSMIERAEQSLGCLSDCIVVLSPGYMRVCVGWERGTAPHQGLPYRQSLSPWNDTLHPTVGFTFPKLLVDFSPGIGSLLGQSSFCTASWCRGPCMSCFTAAVFTSRLDWYRKTGHSPATVSSPPLWLSSRPYAACPRTTTLARKACPLQATPQSVVFGSFAALVRKYLQCLWT